MKICRYRDSRSGSTGLGIVEGEALLDVSAVAEDLPSMRWPLPPGDCFIAHLHELRPRMQALARQAAPRPISGVHLLPPVANPGKFICGAGNFKELLSRGADPRAMGTLFKMTSAAAGPGDGVVLRWPERVTFHEMEMAIVIGKRGNEIAAADALDHVAGYAIGLDMTMQGKEFPDFNKSFDSYGVIGPWLVTADEIPDPSQLGFELHVNGELRTKNSFGELILGVAELIELASSVMTLHPGDVIFTGTPPSGLGAVRPGDVMRARIDRIGEMTVAVRGGSGRKAHQ